jgi:hypothetical protein
VKFRGSARLACLVAAAGVAGTLLSQTDSKIDFQPRVGMSGTRVTITSPVAPGAAVRFGGRTIPIATETNGSTVFVVPPGIPSSFIEIVVDGKVVAKSAVPFVVSGASIVPPKLIGLKEAIDVFAFQDDPRPEGGTRPETPVKPILKIGGSDILTLGESPPAPGVQPAVSMGDLNSASMRGMGPSAFILTARPPVRKIEIPTPTPTPTPGPPKPTPTPG